MKIPVYFTYRELGKFFFIFNENNPTDLRNKLMFLLMYHSGLRQDEIADLRISDIDIPNRFLTTWRGRYAPLFHQGVSLINKYINNLQDLDYIFRTVKSASINRKSIWRILKQYLVKASIVDKPITCPSFRTTRAKHLFEFGSSKEEIVQILDYSSISNLRWLDSLPNSISMHNLNKEYKRF